MTITFSCDRGVVAYSSLERPPHDDPTVVAGGILGGDQSVTDAVRQILTDTDFTHVRVAEPNVDYTFSDARNTVADVAAAMLAVGNGRGQLSDTGWDVLDAALTDHDTGVADTTVIH